jgi:putative DNA primase/helicase
MSEEETMSLRPFQRIFHLRDLEIFALKLPCKNGIINLKTGELEQFNRENYIKKVCPVNYNKNAQCPKFIEFLNKITLGDIERASFIKPVIGYSLLGVLKRKRFFIYMETVEM